MLRAVIYARYSSENQREASIADQVEVCRRYAMTQGWTISCHYEDAATSGASAMRLGFLKLICDAEARQFDVVVCEAIDRLGRKLSDVASAFDRLTFAGIKVHASSIGLLTHMHIGIMGTMAQMTLADLRDKTKRGQLGRARAGRIPGGLAYGYEVVAPAVGGKEAGERRILHIEAEIVRRIFSDYANGASPRKIAHRLNEDNVPGPGGRQWGDTTIRGQVDRGTGLLNNTLYIGRLSWNRCSYVKDPSTGRRVARLNAQSQWEEVDVPELRIVDQELWIRCKQRQKDVTLEIGRDSDGNALNRAHRREFLLSGMLTCGVCSGGYTIIGKDRYGCATRKAKGTCSNRQTITRQSIEARVLGGLRDRLLTSDLVEEFVRCFAQELADLQGREAANQGRLQRELGEVGRRLEGVLRAVENGAWNQSLQTRLTELEVRKAALGVELAGAARAKLPVQLHPNAAAIYRKKVADLEASLNAADIRIEAAEALRALIDRVVLTPDTEAQNGLAVELYGDLAMILGLAAADKPVPARRRADRVGSHEKLPGTDVPGSQLSVVAGTGFEPVTFRL